MTVQILLPFMLLLSNVEAYFYTGPPPSEPQNFTVERTFDGKVFYSWLEPRRLNGHLQMYKISLDQPSGRTVWSASASGSFHKFQLDKELNMNRDCLERVRLKIRAVNEHGTSRPVANGFHIKGPNFVFEAKIDAVDAKTVNISIIAPQYFCYAYDESCEEPEFEVFITDMQDEATAQYWQANYWDKKLSSERRKISLSIDQFKHPGLFWIKLMVFDYTDLVWDSSQRKEVFIGRSCKLL